MLKVLPVNKEYFEKVFPLFSQIPSPVLIAKEVWRNLFEKQWDDQVEPFGYILLDDEQVVGYIGLVSVKRKIKGQVHEIMGLTTWTVDKHYRGGHSMKLLFPFISDQKRTLVCFTPAKSVDIIFRRFGFQEFNAFLQIVPFWVMGSAAGCEISFDIDQKLLSADDWKIYSDHRKFASVHFVIKKEGKYCYVVAKRILKRKLPFLQIHYVSDKNLFAEAIPKFVFQLCCRFKAFGLVGFDSYLGQTLKGARKMEMKSKLLYRSQILKPEDMDSLYSEFFVLNF